MMTKIRWLLCLVAWLALNIGSACSGKNLAGDRGKVFSCLSLDPAKEYIFYEVLQPENDSKVWAFDIQDKISVLVPRDLSEALWTASPGAKWLLTDTNFLQYLDTDTCKIQPLYAFDPKYEFLTPIWLRKDQVLINAFESYPTTTDLYLLDMPSNQAKKLDSEEFVQAVSGVGSEWIQSDGIDLEVVKPQGSATKILEDFKVMDEASPGAIQFLPGTKEFIFIAAQKGNRQYKLWKGSPGHQPEAIFEPDTDSSIVYHQISPDGNYYGFVEQVGDGYSLIFLNLKTNQVDGIWPYPFTITNPEFRWSPDSRSIAIPYDGTRYEPSVPFYKAIQVMDIHSGKQDILMDEKFDSLIGWYAGK